jgi:hypothetical protein
MKHIALAAALLAASAARAAPDPAKDGYRLETKGPAQALKVGETGKLALAIHAEAPWHVDPRAPLTIKVEPSAGLTATRPALTRKDAIDPKAEVPRFEIPVTGAVAGPQEAKAHLKFFLCRETICEQRTRTVAIPVTVK